MVYRIDKSDPKITAHLHGLGHLNSLLTTKVFNGFPFRTVFPALSVPHVMALIL